MPSCINKTSSQDIRRRDQVAWAQLYSRLHIPLLGLIDQAKLLRPEFLRHRFRVIDPPPHAVACSHPRGGEAPTRPFRNFEARAPSASPFRISPLPSKPNLCKCVRAAPFPDLGTKLPLCLSLISISACFDDALTSTESRLRLLFCSIATRQP